MSERLDLTWAIVTRGLSLTDTLDIAGHVYQRIEMDEQPDQWSLSGPSLSAVIKALLDRDDLYLSHSENEPETIVASFSRLFDQATGLTPEAAIRALWNR